MEEITDAEIISSIIQAYNEANIELEEVDQETIAGVRKIIAICKLRASVEYGSPTWPRT